MILAGGSLMSLEAQNNWEKAYLGGGCFWCTEAVYQLLEGVKEVRSGYSGGSDLKPTYENVSAGTTGHAEVIEVTFDPQVISFEKILEMFWKSHDPTTLNRQGYDEGTQYRSIILTTSDAQRKSAEISKTEAQKDFRDPIVTEIKKFETFYLAEHYHQDFYSLNPNYGYCQAIIKPKLLKLGLEPGIYTPK